MHLIAGASKGQLVGSAAGGCGPQDLMSCPSASLTHHGGAVACAQVDHF